MCVNTHLPTRALCGFSCVITQLTIGKIGVQASVRERQQSYAASRDAAHPTAIRWRSITYRQIKPSDEPATAIRINRVSYFCFGVVSASASGIRLSRTRSASGVIPISRAQPGIDCALPLYVAKRTVSRVRSINEGFTESVRDYVEALE